MTLSVSWDWPNNAMASIGDWTRSKEQPIQEHEHKFHKGNVSTTRGIRHRHTAKVKEEKKGFRQRVKRLNNLGQGAM